MCDYLAGDLQLVRNFSNLSNSGNFSILTKCGMMFKDETCAAGLGIYTGHEPGKACFAIMQEVPLVTLILKL